jgi:RNA polymerase sigma-32 factor
MNLCHASDATSETPPRGARATVASRQRTAAADAALGYRWRDQHDISAARQLAGRYRWLVAELADSYRDSGLPWQDLIAEGSVGLMRAICRFDPDRGVGFATSGTWWVNATLQEYVRTSATAARRALRVAAL